MNLGGQTAFPPGNLVAVLISGMSGCDLIQS